MLGSNPNGSWMPWASPMVPTLLIWELELDISPCDLRDGLAQTDGSTPRMSSRR